MSFAVRRVTRGVYIENYNKTKKKKKINDDNNRQQKTEEITVGIILLYM